MRALGRFIITAVLALLGGTVAAPVEAQMGGNTYSNIAFDELEFAMGPTERPVVFDGEAWIGGDFNRLWLKAAGEQDTSGDDLEGSFSGDILYSRSVTPFWNFQTGMRVDHASGEGGETRPRLAVGFEGLARYWFEIEAFAFLGQDGDLTGSFEASYDVLLGQRLILEPEVQIAVASKAIPAFGLGSGFTQGEAGLRLRYEIVREFAPYIGWNWERTFGDTAGLARAAGGEVSESSLVLGLRWWY